MLHDTIFQFVNHYGYIALFGSMVFGIVGLPLPDEILMTFAGFLVSQGELNYITTVITALIGSLCGMSFSFFIGNRFGLSFLNKYGYHIGITAERLEKTKHWFARFGKFTVTTGYFIPGVRYITSYLAGIGKWPYRKFLLYAFFGGLVWVITFITIGVILEEQWWIFSLLIQKYLWMIFVIVLLTIYFFRWHRNRNRR